MENNELIVTTGKYILQDKKPVEEPDLLKWAQWYETADRHIKKTDLPNDVHVSTVFLSIDHGYSSIFGGPPILFETMIFGGEHDMYQERYSTYEEAEEGHQRAVEMVFEVS